MTFLAQCFLCKVKVRLPEGKRGASITCPRCENQFTAAPLQDQADSPSPPGKEEIQRGRSNPAPLMAKSETPLSPEDMAEDPSNLPLPRPWALAAFVLMGLALLSASFFLLHYLTLPLALVSLGAGVAVHFSEKSLSARDLLLARIGAGGSLAILIVALLWPGWFGLAWFGGRDAAPRIEEPLFISRKASADQPPRFLTEDEWVDASAGLIRAGDIQVGVETPRLLKGAKGKDARAARLHFTVHLSNQGHTREITLKGWAAAKSVDEPPLLRDNLHRTYRFLQSVASLDGAASILPGRGHVRELYFEYRPPEGKEAQPEWFFLELPAAAVEETERFRFKVPAVLGPGTRP